MSSISRLREVFDSARQLETEQRAEFLCVACDGDSELRARVDALLAADQEAGSFLQDDDSAGANLPFHQNLDRTGSAIGPYKVREQLAEGGMGVVYVAEQEHPIRRKVALKVIKPGLATNEVIARFESERQALALMNHPNIAQVLDVGTTADGQPYFVMELVRGISVTQYCDQQRLSTRQRLRLFLEICDAVQHSHRRGIIHRDIKPSNVLVGELDGAAVSKVIDFGVAKALNQSLSDRTVYTRFAQMVGTPTYMSPEQAGLHLADIDTRTDVYSLGVLLYELLTSRTPFDCDTLRQADFDEVRRIIREEEPRRPSAAVSTLQAQLLSTVSQQRACDPVQLRKTLSGELDWLVMKALEKDRNRRYESAAALADDIRRYLNDEPVFACPPSTWYRLSKYARRHRAQVVTVTAIAFVLTAATIVSSLLAAWALRERRLAQSYLSTSQQNEQTALDARERAEHQEQMANQQRDSALLNRYYAEMVSGQADWERGDLSRLHAKLMGHLPVVGEQDRRGWEWYYLQSLCHPEQRTLFFPGRSPFATWSPDGEYIAASGSIWRAESGENIRQLIPSTIARKFGAWSPSGRKFAWGTAGDDNGIYVWDRETDQLVQLRGHTQSVWSVSWSPDGKQLASGGPDKTLKIWDVAEAAVRKTLPAEDQVISVSWSPDGKLIAAGMRWNRVTIWDAHTSEVVASRDELGEKADVYWMQVAWHPDGDQLAVTTPRSWFLFRRSDWKLLRQQDLALARGQAIAWHPDGQSLAVVDGKEVSVWRAEGGPPLRTLKGHLRDITAVTWSPDGRQLVTSGYQEEVRIWDLRVPIQPPSVATGGPVQSLSWLPDNDTVVTTNDAGDSRSHWSVPDGRQLKKVERPFVEGKLLWNEHGRFGAQVIGSESGPTVRVVEVTTGEVYSTWQGEPTDVVRHVAWSSEGGTLAIRKNFGSETCVELWDVHRASHVSRWSYTGVRSPHDHSSKIDWSPDGTRLAVGAVGEQGDDGSIAHQSHLYVIRVANGETLLKHNPGGRYQGGALTSVSWGPTGRVVVAGFEDGLVEAIEIESGRKLFGESIHASAVTALAWSPDGQRIASADISGTVKIQGARGGEDLLEFNLADGVTHVAWSPNGKRLAAATSSGQVHVWDASRGYDFSETGSRRGELAWAYWSQSRARDQARISRALELAPDSLAFWQLRGDARATLGDFNGAAEEFAKAIEHGVHRSFKPALSYGYALLGARRSDAYDQHCEFMLDQFADTAVPFNGSNVAALCNLTTDSEIDREEVLRMADSSDDQGDWTLLQRGAALFRSQRLERAVTLLSDLAGKIQAAADPAKRTDLACAMYFLAMAHHELQHTNQAGNWLRKANDFSAPALAEDETSSSHGWKDRVILRQLRKEAETSLRSHEP